MHPLFKNRPFQVGSIIAVAATGFGWIALITSKQQDPVTPPVRIAHASVSDSAASVTTTTPPTSIAPPADVPNPASPAPLPTPTPLTIPSPAPSAPAVTHVAAPAESPTVMVHVAGLVERPAVYRVPANYRVFDAIRVAGGLRPGGDTDVINLAARLQDGEQIYVPPLSAVQS
nr:SLBB domain-containing protein [Armatimonadota bacterium]